MAALGLTAAVLVAGCGSEEPDTQAANAPGASAPATMAPDEQNGGTTAEVGDLVEVIGARVPDPGTAARKAQLEMTLAVANPGTPVTLTSVSTPAAAHVAMLSHGRAVSGIPVPDSAGSHVATGAPSPDEIRFTGLRHPLKRDESIKVTLSFGKTATTLNVPVTTAP